MIRSLGRSVGNAVLDTLGRAAGRVQENTTLPADILEGQEAYLVVFDAPGANVDDVQVQYLDGRIAVRVDRFRELHEGFEMRYPGRGLSFDGSVSLPDDADVDPERAAATLGDDGTLRVRVPRLSNGERTNRAVTDDASDRS